MEWASRRKHRRHVFAQTKFFVHLAIAVQVGKERDQLFVYIAQQVMAFQLLNLDGGRQLLDKLLKYQIIMHVAHLTRVVHCQGAVLYPPPRGRRCLGGHPKVSIAQRRSDSLWQAQAAPSAETPPSASSRRGSGLGMPS